MCACMKWRLSGNAPIAGANVEIVWPHANKQDSLRAFGYPEAADQAQFGEYIEGLHEQGLKGPLRGQ